MSDNEFLIFVYGENEYCINTSFILEVKTSSDITDVPGNSDRILGMVDFRGEVFTVLNIASILEMPKSDEDFFVVCKEDKNGNRNIIPCTSVIGTAKESNFDKSREKERLGAFLPKSVKDVHSYKNKLVIELNLDTINKL